MRSQFFAFLIALSFLLGCSETPEFPEGENTDSSQPPANAPIDPVTPPDDGIPPVDPPTNPPIDPPVDPPTNPPIDPPAPPNNKPTATGSNHLLLEGESTSIIFSGSDADNDPITLKIIDPPQKGELSGNTNDGFVYRANDNQSGIDEIRFVFSDGLENSNEASIKIFIVAQVKQKNFWLKSEDIKTKGKDGSLISDWKDTISLTSPYLKNNSVIPRFVSSFNKSHAAAKFEFRSGNRFSNDFLYFPETYVFSNTGITIFTIGSNTGRSSNVSPVVSFGDWTSQAWGLNWSASYAGIVSPTNHSGSDSKGILKPVPNKPTILIGQIQTRFSSGEALQRARFLNQDWTMGSKIALPALSNVEVAAKSSPKSNGSPIMIGAHNNFEKKFNERWNGQIAEILIIGEPLSKDDILVIESALAKKFDLD